MQGHDAGVDAHGHWPWWERTLAPSGLSYHSMSTRCPDSRIGLLVDPGAHDNLSGESTLRVLARQATGDDVFEEKELDRPLRVAGVGREAQETVKAGKVRFRVRDQNGALVDSSYTAPYIAHSSLPNLLGLKSLREKKTSKYEILQGGQPVETLGNF